MAGIVMFGKNTNTGPSPGLWGLAPRDVFYDPAVAYGFSQEFVDLPILVDGAEAVIAGGGGWKGFGSTGAAAVSGAQDDEDGGSYSLASDLANEGASISGGHAPHKLTRLAEDFFFECRIKASTVVANDLGFFVGMMGITAASAVIPIEAADDIADTNLVGFHYPGGATTSIGTLYRADSVAEVDVKTAAVTIAAATYLKLGMVVQKGKLTFFLNGVPLADTKSLPDGTGTDFPADTFMRPIIAMLHGSGATGDVTASWIHTRQLRVM
ncbi:MAG: hypothetical protein IIB38_00420 [Candidatus Hydrogenedentes bacterium]|nr:hypothetical protein [Candidatus Hydrogenedentota bacterium]